MGKKNTSDVEGAKWKSTEVRSAIINGSLFALRIGELEKLEDRDVSFEEVYGVTCIAIIIRCSKTD